jgi:hypothetical protein
VLDATGNKSTAKTDTVVPDASDSIISIQPSEEEMWRYYNNRDPETSWVVPWRTGGRTGEFCTVTPQYVAESDFGVKLGLIGLKRFEAWMVYQYREHIAHYIVDSVYTEVSITNSSPISSFLENSLLIVLQLIAKSPFDASETELFLRCVTNSKVLNALFDASDFKLYRPIGAIVPAGWSIENLKAI